MKDGESHGVLYRILTSIKQSVDTQHPESSEANKVSVLIIGVKLAVDVQLSFISILKIIMTTVRMYLIFLQKLYAMCDLAQVLIGSKVR